jgi:hypothetical protein
MQSRHADLACMQAKLDLLCCAFIDIQCSQSLLVCSHIFFLRAGVLQASIVLLHPCLRILLAIYNEATACMRQLICALLQ